MPRITLVTRDGCHLCAEARSWLEGLRARTGEQFSVVDVDADLDPRDRERYTDLVPVVLVDGEEVSRWRLDPARLHGALADPPSLRPSP